MSRLKEKTICLAPWMSIHNWPDGKTYPCCLWDSGAPIGNLNDSSVKEIWNSEPLKQARLGMLKGEKISACSRCYELESSGEHSYRQRINETHSKCEKYLEETNPDGSLDNMNLHLWDLRISNFCNFKCRSCGSELSSSWYEDVKALGKDTGDKKALISVTDKSKFLEDIEPHYSCVDEIYFAGGEPLLMPEHYQILDKLISLNRTDVTIRYSTNFSKLNFGKKDILEYWKNFKNIELYISVDGVGKIGEYVRKGYNNQIFIDNILKFRESNIKTTAFGYTITYGVLNFLHLFDMILEFMEKGLLDFENFTDDSPTLVFNPITYPPYYDCKFTPDRYKKLFVERYNAFPSELSHFGAKANFIDYTMRRLEPVKNYILSANHDPVKMEEFVNITNKLDKIRTEKFTDIFSYFANPEALTSNASHVEKKQLI